MNATLNEKSTEKIDRIVSEVRAAQEKFSTYSQEKTDEIFFAAAMAASSERIPLAKAAYEETGRGVMEDKVIKNHFAAEYVYNAYKNTKTVGVIEEDSLTGIKKIAEPLGVIAAVIPTTNPTSTAIFKILLALKTRNGIIISPHPAAKECTVMAARIMAEAAYKAGAPRGIISWLTDISTDSTSYLMSQCDIVLATGGPGMVRAAYSCGKPALGVGSGNTPVIIDKSADITLAVNSVIHSKIFDNGMICASEQALIADAAVYESVREEFVRRGCKILDEEEKERLRLFMFPDGRKINPDVVGMSASKIAGMASITAPSDTKILIAELEDYSDREVLAKEKLSPVLALYKSKDFEQALEIADRLVREGGIGHTSSIYIDEIREKEKLDMFERRMKTGRILVNTPASFGAIGDIYNFALSPSLTLGCGSWGGNSVSENVGVKHLMNIKTVAHRRENTLWAKAPEKVYMKRGCLVTAIKELAAENKKRAFVVTDRFLEKSGLSSSVTKRLADEGIDYTVFSGVEPDPVISCVIRGAEEMKAYEPDLIVAVGGGSAMDAAKIMWALYEHPELDFTLMAERFSDIRKRIYTFPEMGQKAYFVAVPTTAGTGSEVTPFSVITDDISGIKYPVADYELMPDMAVIDADLQLTVPKGLTAASGIDALTHAIEAYGSMMATDYTDGLSCQAVQIIFEYLPLAYNEGENNPYAREKMSVAAAIAGMAFANAFLGLCHSMAHKLGAYFHLPHGVANALLITYVMRYNADPVPEKMGLFPQYQYPKTLERYAKLSQYAGVCADSDETRLEGFINKINELKKCIGIKSTIREYVPEEDKFFSVLDRMAQDAFDDQCTGANPRYPLIREIKEIYTKAYYGE